MNMPRWSPGDDDKQENGYRLNLLDGFGLFRGDQEVTLQIGCQRLIALLALVGVKSRSYIAGTLWPDVKEAQASGSLRSTVWRVQRLAPNLIQAHGPVLIVDPKTRVDVASFIDDVRQLLTRPAEVDLDHQLTQAMWNDLLPGWYDDWVLVERERLHQLQLHALETLALQLSAGGQHGHALDTALVAVRAEPLRESAHRVVAQVHLLEGNRLEALRQFRRYSELLKQELGAEPSAEFAAMVSAPVLRSTPIR